MKRQLNKNMLLLNNKQNIKNSFSFKLIIEGNRMFSISKHKLIDNPDRILEKARAMNKEMRKFHEDFFNNNPRVSTLVNYSVQFEGQKAECIQKDTSPVVDNKEEMDFLTKARIRINNWMADQDKIEEKLTARIDAAYKHLTPEEGTMISNKYDRLLEKIQDKGNERSLNLENLFTGLKPINYFTQKVSQEGSVFKDLVQIKQKQEAAIHDILKTRPDYDPNSEIERQKFNDEIIVAVRASREERKKLDAYLVQNLESPCELAESLSQEMGPDYTGGDD
jgi:hypothetical protein